MQRSKLYFLASLLLSCAFTQHAEPFVARAYYSTAEAQLAQTGAGGSGTGAKVFLSAAGNDSNDCLTPLTSCLTPSHVSGLAFVGLKVTINLNGGDTIGGGTSGFVLTTAFTTASVSIQDYGTGQATVSTGNSAACVSITNLPAPSIVNIICTGGGNTTNTTAGISIVNSQAGNTKLAGPTISGVTLSGYGYNGISIQGASGTSGFNGITIAGNTITNVTGNSTDAFGTCGIFVFSKTGYGSGAITPAHINVTITGNKVSNATGNSGASANWSGCGIFASQSANIVIGGSPANGNVAHDFGGSNGSTFEPVGVWVADDGGTCEVSYNEAYNGLTGTNSAHSDGFAIDGGAINCMVEKNKSHDNAGLGVLLENYFDGTCCALWANNTVRFNLLQNNAGENVSALNNIHFNFVANATGPAYVYNNTIVSQNGAGAIGDASFSTSTIAATIANNVLAVNNSGKLVNFTNVGAINLYNNDYYTYGTPFSIAWGGTSYSSFSSWQTATGQEKIGGSNVGLTTNPQIYVPGGLFTTGGYLPTQDMASNLQAGSPMIGAGLNLQTQFGINPGASDYYGVSISAASLPVGAANGDFATFVASCSASTNFLARVSSFAKLDNVNYNSLLCGLNSDGNWSHLDFLHVLAAPNSAASLLNLVGTSFSLVSHGLATFTAFAGYASNGSTGYLDTQYTPSTAGGNMTLNSGSIGVYDVASSAANKALIGATNNTTTEISIFTQSLGAGKSWFVDVNDFTGGCYGACSDSNSGVGLFVGVRPNATQMMPWQDGTNKNTASVNSVALTPDSIFVLAENVAGVPQTISTDTIALDFLGDGSINQLNLSLRANSFMQAYGINVY